ncbi:MAG: TolC family protein [Deltaproteobacteria bacterium]|nr:TolC family protein [Deltaproteobacteria bacterium]
MHLQTLMGCGVFVVSLVLLSSTGLPEQVRALNLSDAIEASLKNNRQLKAARQQTEAAKSGVGEAMGSLLPRVDIIEGFNYSDKPTLVFSNLLDQASFKQKNFELGPLNEPTPLTNLSSQIRLEQSLYSGGRLLASLRQAKASAEASQEVTRRSQQELILQVIEAYYQALLTQGNVELVSQALASAAAHLQRTRDLFEKGLVVRSDYLRTQVHLGGLEREKIEAENALTLSHSRLRYILGTEERFELTDRVMEDGLPLIDLFDLLADAKERRPDLKAAEKEVERAAEGIQVAEADYYPHLGFITQFESNTRKFSTSGENFAVFVTARWNLFNGFATREKVTAQTTLHRRAVLLRDDLRYAIGVQVEQAYLGLLAARKQIGVARENVAQAQENLRIVSDRYQAGLARNVDALDAETVLKSAEQDLLRARVQTQIFRARLNLATGQMQ